MAACPILLTFGLTIHDLCMTHENEYGLFMATLLTLQHISLGVIIISMFRNQKPPLRLNVISIGKVRKKQQHKSPR